jgi:hypothetical protein
MVKSGRGKARTNKDHGTMPSPDTSKWWELGEFVTSRTDANDMNPKREKQSVIALLEEYIHGRLPSSMQYVI